MKNTKTVILSIFFIIFVLSLLFRLSFVTTFLALKFSTIVDSFFRFSEYFSIASNNHLKSKVSANFKHRLLIGNQRIRHHRHRGQDAATNRTKGLFVLPTVNHIVEVPPPWGDIAMPKKSYFAGFNAPNDTLKWNQAQLQASRGEQVLLKKVLEVIKSPFDLHQGQFQTGTDHSSPLSPLGDPKFKWIHRISELHKSKHDNWLNDLEHMKGHKAPIVMMGYRKFDRAEHEGREFKHMSMGPNEILMKKGFKVPRKIVAIGCMDENWGWLSSYFLNRTVHWGINFGGTTSPLDPKFRYAHEQIRPFLDDPNVLMVLVNQHHNMSHPKVISVPLGIVNIRDTFTALQKAARISLKKEHLFFTAGSNYGHRPDIRNCIREHLGNAFTVFAPMPTHAFNLRIISSYAVLAMPGLGYDTYRMWETLASGSMPVAERGMGLDRTFYRLPVLLLDDYYDLTEAIIRQAYVETLYRADDWEYVRMTRRWWEHLIYEVSEAADIAPLLEKHPLIAEDMNFTRPLIPFDCEAMGGCGPGTKRTPKKSCAIDPSRIKPGYDWIWTIK